MTKNIVLIFADGSSRGNPGRGGYGAIVISGSSSDFLKNKGNIHVKELGEGEALTTNNKMELSAVISALEYSKLSLFNEESEFNIYTDSKYVVNGSKMWIFGWQKNGWKTAAKEDVKNKELWQVLSYLIAGKNIKWHLLPGHAGILGNERCDEIATNFADKKTDSLFDGKLSKYSNEKILDIFYNPELIKEAKDNKKASGSSKGAKAYSYVSKVNGVINVDSSWADCERRVKGKAGALYKKSASLSDQEKIVKDFASR